MPATAQLEDATLQLNVLLHHAALSPLDDLGWLRVTGEDRVRWLNGMVTNSITDLAPGRGCYNFVLSAQGRIQGDLTAFAEPDSILLQTDRAQIPTLLALLDRFIIMDDVELTDVTADRASLSLTSPQAHTILAAIGLPPPELDPMNLAHVTWHGQSIELVHAHSPLVPRYELWATPEIITTLTEALTTAGAAPVTPEALEALRILEGTPRYGTDIRNSDTAKELPQETAQTRALHFAKGCYLGQEIVERIRSRGNVHRTFTGFRLTGPLPTAGILLEADGKSVGELTSVAAIPLATGTEQLALGYIRREALDRGATLTYPGGEAVPAPLPFAIP